MKRRRKHQTGRWTVITPGGSMSDRRGVPSQAWTFGNPRRAHNLASNIRGARVSGPKPRAGYHARRSRIGWWLWLAFAVLLIAAGLGLLSRSGGG